MAKIHYTAEGAVRADRAWEPVKADVVFGEDGMARAIRFVP